jgi:HAD superfamily hydrolase (TIGR01509 family)
LISVVLFDLGNVVVKLKYEDFLARIGAACAFAGKEELHEAFSAAEGPHHAVEKGEISLEDLHASLVRRFGLRWDFGGFLHHFNDFFLPNPPMESLMEDLQGQAELWALSNTNASHIAHVIATYPVFRRFKQILKSNEMGLRKPDPLIFQRALESIGRPAEEIFFIDDNAANVRAALACGMQGFHYTFNDSSLREALIGAGLNL